MNVQQIGYIVVIVDVPIVLQRQVPITAEVPQIQVVMTEEVQADAAVVQSVENFAEPPQVQMVVMLSPVPQVMMQAVLVPFAIRQYKRLRKFLRFGVLIGWWECPLRRGTRCQ